MNLSFLCVVSPEFRAADISQSTNFLIETELGSLFVIKFNDVFMRV